MQGRGSVWPLPRKHLSHPFSHLLASYAVTFLRENPQGTLYRRDTRQSKDCCLSIFHVLSYNLIPSAQ